MKQHGLLAGMASVVIASTGLAGCGASAEEKAWEACLTAEAARAASGDQTYAGIAPANPQFPSREQASLKVYDTGVMDFTAIVGGVKFSCLYVPKSGRATVGWGE